MGNEIYVSSQHDDCLERDARQDRLDMYNFIFDIYRESPYGPLLYSHVRFRSFMPQNEEPDHWQKILGKHVNNLLHMPETYKDTDAFILAQKTQQDKRQFSDHEEHLLRLYGMIHDMAEVILDDTPDTQKANKEYAMKLEMEILDHIVDALYGFDPTLVSDMHEAIDAIGRGKDDFLNQAFRTIECIGYAEVAVEAGPHISDAETMELKEGLQRLVVSVTQRGYPEIKKQANTFVFAKQFVDRYDQFFTEATTLYPSLFAS